MKLLKLILFLLLAGFSAVAADQAGSPAAPAILPKVFGGWQMQGSAHLSTDPAVADPVNAALLKEYGFTDFASSVYARDDGRKLTVKAARFGDASGAYGAFTFYKTPEMLTEKIGDLASSLNERVLFLRGNVLVDAVFEKLSAMSAAELRDLSSALPLPQGNLINLPSVPAYLPKQAYVKNSAKYVEGPIGLEKINSPIPASLVDFGAGAEAVLGTYYTSTGDATLAIIAYPTPQIAGDHLRKLEAAVHPAAGSSQPALMNGPVFGNRTGPLLVIATGAISESEAKSLLASVNYEADVTWNQNTHFDKKNNVANLLVNVIILCGIIAAFSVAAGVAFGGLRLLVKRIWPDKVFDRPEQIEFISLHLSDRGPGAPESR
jgi:hypothetical protein